MCVLFKLLVCAFKAKLTVNNVQENRPLQFTEFACLGEYFPQVSEGEEQVFSLLFTKAAWEG